MGKRLQEASCTYPAKINPSTPGRFSYSFRNFDQWNPYPFRAEPPFLACYKEYAPGDTFSSFISSIHTRVHTLISARGLSARRQNENSVCDVSNKSISTGNAFDFLFAKLSFKMRKRKKASILILFSLLVSSAAFKGKIYTLVKNNLLTFRKKNPHEVLKKMYTEELMSSSKW